MESEKKTTQTDPVVVDAVKQAYLTKSSSVRRLEHDLWQQTKLRDQMEERLKERIDAKNGLWLWLQKHGVDLADAEAEEECAYCSELVSECVCEDPEDE